MNDTLEQIRQLVANGSYRISDHGYDELSADGLLESLNKAVLVEEYLNYPK